MQILLGILIGFIAGYFIGKRAEWRAERVPAEVETIKRGRILLMVQERGEIQNHDVRELLGVSDATATRYLDALEKEGEIEQVGSDGRSVKYRKRG